MRRNFLHFLVFALLIVINLSQAGWVMRHPMRFARYGPMVAAVNNKLYVIGGLVNQTQSVSHVEEYNPVLDTWITKAPMPTARAFGVCGVINGKIYVIGGIRRSNVTVESCEVFDPVLNQWQRRRSLPTRRTGFNGSVIGDTVYVCGGYFTNSMTYTDTVECYSASRDSWFIRSSMNSARVEFGATNALGKIYAIGGLFYSSYQNVNEVYNPANNSWQIRANLPFARTGLVCATRSNRVYAIGGQRHAPRIIFARVDIYNPDNDTWILGESLNIARVYAGAATINNRIYVVGGLGPGNTPTSSLEEYFSLGIEDANTPPVFLPKLSVSPNPFQYQTTLRFSLPMEKNVLIQIYNNFGHLVKTIRAGNSSGTYIWDGTDEFHKHLPSGVYFAKVINVFNQTNPLIKFVILR